MDSDGVTEIRRGGEPLAHGDRLYYFRLVAAIPPCPPGTCTKQSLHRELQQTTGSQYRPSSSC